MSRLRLIVSGLVLLLAIAGGVAPLAGCGGSAAKESMSLGGINTGEVLDGLLARTQRAMAQVSNVDTARRVVPELERINEDYDDLIFHLPKLSDEGRAELAKQSARALPRMQAMVEQIHGMDALDRVLGDVLEGMLARLEQVR